MAGSAALHEGYKDSDIHDRDMVYPLASKIEQMQIKTLRRELEAELSEAKCSKFPDCVGYTSLLLSCLLYLVNRCCFAFIKPSYLSHPASFRDIRLLRFLRGYSHDVTQAAAAVKEFLELRSQYDLDTLREELDGKDCVEESIPEYAEVQKYMPSYLTAGLSSKGHPVVYIPLGDHDTRAALANCGADFIVKAQHAGIPARHDSFSRLACAQSLCSRRLGIAHAAAG